MQLDDLLAGDVPYATFHDASVERVTLDYAAQEAVLECSICVGNPDSAHKHEREARRRGNLTFEGLLYCVIEPPDSTYPYADSDGLWVSADGPLDKSQLSEKGIPENLPDGSVVHYFFINDWNAFIYLAARTAHFEWTDK